MAFPGEHPFTLIHEPNLGQTASVTVPAVSGKYFVLKALHGSLATDATAQPPIALQVKSDSTVIATWVAAAPASTGWGIDMGENELNIRTNPGASLTVAFGAGAVASSAQRIAIGYTVKYS